MTPHIGTNKGQTVKLSTNDLERASLLRLRQEVQYLPQGKERDWPLTGSVGIQYTICRGAAP